MIRRQFAAATLAAAVVAAPIASQAKDFEALSAEVSAVSGSIVYVVVAKGPKEALPVADGIASALREKLNKLGYMEPKFPEQHELGKGQKTGAARPSIDDPQDAVKWMKGGHKVHAAMTGGLIGIATAAHATEVGCNAVVVVEAQLKSGGKGFLGKMASKAGVPGSDKAKGDEVYQYRMTVVDEKGNVAYSAVETVSKDELDKRLTEARNKKTDEMVDKMSAAVDSQQAPKPNAEQQAQADKMKADMEAKMTPEQREQMAKMQAMMPAGQMQAMAQPAGGSYMKNIMKITAKANAGNKEDSGGPERWGMIIVDDSWTKLASVFKK